MIDICECWMRDGLQPETYVPTSDKLEMLERLSRAGFGRIEVTSLVRADLWPQFADAEDVLRRYRRSPSVEYSVLLPNRRALDRALAVEDGERRFDAAIVILAASDAYMRRNVGRSTAEQLRALDTLIGEIRARDRRVIANVGTAWACPIEGETPVERVVELAAALTAAGADEIMLGDTTGEASPWSVERLVASVVERVGVPVVGHFHEARGTALANAVAAVRAGARWLDCSLGGLGGHRVDDVQHAPAGNVCTEDLVTVLASEGLVPDIDLDAVITCGEHAQAIVGRPLSSRVLRSGLPAFARKVAA